MDWSLVLQIVGTALGFLYLWLEYKANIWLWVVGALMPMVHGVLYLQSGIYADAAMQLYYVLAGLYGLCVWKRGSSAKKEMTITHTPIGWVLPLVLVYAVLNIALYFLLTEFTDSQVPLFDSISTALSIVAMWMLSRKLVEQWLVWLVVDAISVGLYFYKGIPITGCLYLVYCVLAVVGYMRWMREVRKGAGTESEDK